MKKSQSRSSKSMEATLGTLSSLTKATNGETQKNIKTALERELSNWKTEFDENKN